MSCCPHTVPVKAEASGAVMPRRAATILITNRRALTYFAALRMSFGLLPVKCSRQQSYFLAHNLKPLTRTSIPPQA